MSNFSAPGPHHFGHSPVEGNGQIGLSLLIEVVVLSLMPPGRGARSEENLRNRSSDGGYSSACDILFIV